MADGSIFPIAASAIGRQVASRIGKEAFGSSRGVGSSLVGGIVRGVLGRLLKRR